MQPRRHRNGKVFWRHVDERHADGGWRCRSCAKRSAAPWRFYCSASCRKAFLESVPPFWPELATKVRRRDGHRCVLCGSSGKDKLTLRARLEVDHIKPVALFPELEFDETNLRTLCRPCHAKHGARPQSQRWRRIHGPRAELGLQAYATAGGTGGPAGADAAGHLPQVPLSNGAQRGP